MTNKTSAIQAALPAIPPKPKIAATIAMIRKTTAQYNNAITTSASVWRLKIPDTSVFKARKPIPGSHSYICLPRTGLSTSMTSAPMSARKKVHPGPATVFVKSTTLMPSSMERI